VTKQAPNVWDEGRWADVTEVTIDFMTRYIIEQILNVVSPKGKTVLELGSGTGRLSYLLLRHGAKKVTLLDSSKKALELTRGLFRDVPSEQWETVEAEILEFNPGKKYDIVFSSGVVEHFMTPETRAASIHKHLDLGRECVILHPTDTIYNRLFCKFPPAVKLYGFEVPFSDEEMESYIAQRPEFSKPEHRRFHYFYCVPLHNFSAANRFIDHTVLGRRSGLTLTFTFRTGEIST